MAVNVKATSVAAPTKSASATVTIVAAAAILLSISPTSASVPTAGVQLFTASAAETSNTAVTWGLSGAGCSGSSCGTLSTSSLTAVYSAPSVTPSIADPTKSASAEVTITPIIATSYYLATAADGGSDSHNGLSPGAPWLTPNHALNCGDTITAAAGTYDAANFAYNKWGKVTCSAGNNVAWLKCATFDACKINATLANQHGMMISRSYWGVQGWEVTTSSTSGTCFGTEGVMGYNIHHIIFANDIANVCGKGGFSASPYSGYGVDYFVVVGSIAYNAAQNSTYCFSGINAYEPVAQDKLPGTHYYFSGNFAFDNIDPNPCNGTAPTDGNGLYFDTFDGSGTSQSPFTGQSVIDNNIAVFNGSRGVISTSNSSGTLHAPTYLRHNTTYGNETDLNQNTSKCGEFLISSSLTTEVYANLAETTAATACTSNMLYVYYVNGGNATDHVYGNYGYSAPGNNTGSSNNNGFSFGPNNVFPLNPNFVNPVDPGAPSCGSASSVPNCMATVIANFTPQAAAAANYGYQKPSTTQTYDPLFPQWLCNVNLPAGLITMGCLTASSLPASPP